MPESQKHTTIRVSDFTDIPGARYRDDGPFSGEQYREEYLLPAFDLALSEGARLLVDLDNVQGYATSFLEEAFGGLARERGAQLVIKTLVFKCEDDPELSEEIMFYINRTAAK